MGSSRGSCIPLIALVTLHMVYTVTPGHMWYTPSLLGYILTFSLLVGEYLLPATGSQNSKYFHVVLKDLHFKRGHLQMLGNSKHVDLFEYFSKVKSLTFYPKSSLDDKRPSTSYAWQIKTGQWYTYRSHPLDLIRIP